MKLEAISFELPYHLPSSRETKLRKHTDLVKQSLEFRLEHTGL